MAKYYKVKNLLGVSLSLRDALGDEVKVPPGSTHKVEARFIDFQLPPLQQAIVLGYDYDSLLKPSAKVAVASDASE